MSLQFRRHDSTLDESKQLLAHRRMMPAILCTQLPAVLIPDLQPEQCETRSCSNPSPIRRGLRDGSLSLANKYDTVWKLASLRDDHGIPILLHVALVNNPSSPNVSSASKEVGGANVLSPPSLTYSKNERGNSSVTKSWDTSPLKS